LTRRRAPAEGALLLDSQGLSLLLAGDRFVQGLVAEALKARRPAVVSALTIVETVHKRTDEKRLDWFLSRLRVEGVDPADSKVAVRLLLESGVPRAHEHAIDALLAALALRLARRTVVVTSDPGDWELLAGGRVGIVAV
jgi:hypothetical protein